MSLAIVRANPACHRGQADDLAGPLLHHVGQNRAGVIEGAVEVGAEDKVPRLGRHLPGWLQFVDPGVIDQDVDATVFIYSRLHHFIDLFFVGRINLQADELAAMLFAQLLRQVERAFGMSVANHYPCAFGSQSPSDCLSNTSPGRGRNNSDLILEFHGFPPLTLDLGASNVKREI